VDHIFKKDSEDLGNASDVVGNSARRLWTKPVLERLSLKDALTQPNTGSDGPAAAS
jgi:hypothetical protein